MIYTNMCSRQSVTREAQDSLHSDIPLMLMAPFVFPTKDMIVVGAYLYSNASLSFQVHKVHGGSDLVLPFHLQTGGQTDRQTDRRTDSDIKSSWLADCSYLTSCMEAIRPV